jgi:hypothetical protein
MRVAGYLEICFGPPEVGNKRVPYVSLLYHTLQVAQQAQRT